jgi:hypothetical protein
MFDLVSVKSSYHGRERREQRQIDKSDATLARRYGIAELGGGQQQHMSLSHGGARKYTYKGAVFVISNNNREITCFHSSDYASPFSGTRVTLPVLYPMDTAGYTDEALERHKSLKRKLRKLPGFVVSHTVFCVSMSSLMRQDDVNGARCRSDAIWAALARGLAPGTHDSDRHRLVSVVVLVDSTCKVVLRHEPVDSVLYNRLLSLRADWATLRPHGQAVVDDEVMVAIRSLFLHGNESRQLKPDRHDSASRTSLVFIGSDDMIFSEASSEPSLRRQSVAGLVDEGCVHRVAGIALGDDSDAAATMKCLLSTFDEASDGSIICGLKRVPLELDALIQSVADVTTSEKSTAMPGSSVSAETEEHSATSSFAVTGSDEKWLPAVIEKVYKWSEVAKDMAALVDSRCASCWTLISRASSDVSNFIEAPRSPVAESQSGWLCASCEARYYCVDCMSQFTLHLGSTECARIQRERQAGRIVSLPVTDQNEMRMLPSYRIEIEQAQSAAAVVFAGQKLRCVTRTIFHGSHASSCAKNESTAPVMVCHRIGHGHWEDVDPAVRRHYETVCRFHAIAGRIAKDFSEQFAASRATHGSPIGLHQVRVQPAIILEVKGGDGGGCYFVLEEHGHAAVKMPPSDLKRDDMAALEALGHYAVRVHHFPLLVSKAVRFEVERAILITDLIIQHSDAGSQQAMEAFFRSHVCNNVCKVLHIA